MGAAWVLFKLDGGLDHLLLDEVQDTAPEQWLIADLLTADFFAGKGTRPDGALPRRFSPSVTASNPSSPSRVPIRRSSTAGARCTGSVSPAPASPGSPR